MRYWKGILAAGALLGAFAISVLAQGELNDPYQILNRYFNAVGGLDNLRAEHAS